MYSTCKRPGQAEEIKQITNYKKSILK